MVIALGVEGASPAPTMGVAAKGGEWTKDEDNEGSADPELGPEENMFRAVAARLNYLSQDPPRCHVRHHENVLKDVSATDRT